MPFLKRRPDNFCQHDSALAGAHSARHLPRTPAAYSDHGNQAAHHRHLLSDHARWHLLYSRPFGAGKRFCSRSPAAMPKLTWLSWLPAANAPVKLSKLCVNFRTLKIRALAKPLSKERSSSATLRVCRLPPANRQFIPPSPSANTNARSGSTFCYLPTQPLAGHRPCAK